jgi:uncharacterized membrane protein YwzB
MPRHNWLAIALCTVINFIFSNVWFGPLFGAKWYIMHNIVMDKANGTFTKNGVSPDFNPILLIISAVTGAFISAFLLSYLYRRIGVTDWKDGLMTGATIGLFAFIGLSVNNLFSCNPFELSLIEGGAAVVLFAIYGAILGGWKKKQILNY